MHEQNYSQAPVHQPAAGYAPVPAGPGPKRSHTGALVAVAAVVALLLIAGGLALFGPFRTASSTEETATNGLPSSKATTGATDSGEIPTSIEVPGAPVDEAPTTVAPAVAPTGGQVPTAGPVPTGNNGGSSSGGAPAPQAPPAPPAPATPAAPAPVITSFTTPENIDCHNGDFQMFTASWSTTNATKVTISIDGPGVYKTYGPTGSDSLPFSCSSAHTFLLTAYGHDGSTVTKSITLQPRNVQMPSSGDEDAQDQGAAVPASPDEL